jgi:ABC-type bacteriocin/lantibiotic exporter with double-glycine peptidase domain
MKWFAQEQRTSCVAACVRMVLSHFGQEFSESDLRQRLQVSTFGLSLEDATAQLELLGVTVALHENWNSIDLRDCLREGFFPIVGVERRIFGHSDAGHAVVLRAINSQFAEVLDQLGQQSSDELPLVTFEKAWVEAGRQALVIQSPFPT